MTLDVGETIRVDLAMGGQPVRSYAAALTCIVDEHLPDGGTAVSVLVAHDDECPVVRSGELSECTCEIVTLQVTRCL